MILNNSDKRIKSINEIINICKKYNSRPMILGATDTGKKIEKYLYDNGVRNNIQFVVDDKYISEEQIEDGVIKFSEYLEKYANTSPLIFGFYNYEIIKARKESYKSRIPYMYDFHITVVNGKRIEWSYEFVISREDEYKATYDMLSNYKSKQTMQAYLNAAIAGEFDQLFTFYREIPPYFNNNIDNYKIEKLFDCGAFDGDSIHDFIAAYPDYKKLYAFEPDKANIDKIKDRIKREGIHDLQIIDKGVWSETTTLHFESDGTSMSSISDEGAQTIEVIKLDDMYDCFDSKSLIKMDIEGSELEALKGAEKIIKEIKPALAICVYHRREDLITIPQYIDSLAPQGTYDYYLGYQGLDLAELVFYAVPKK